MRLAYTPTRRLALLAALVAPLWLLSWSTVGTFVASAAIVALLAAMLLDIVRAPGADAIELEREAPSTVGLGDTATCTYRLQSRWPRALVVSIHDRLPAALRPEDPSPAGAALQPAPPVATVSLQPGGGEAAARPILGRTRGAAVLGPVALRIRGPLGLVDRLSRPLVQGDQTVAVAPSVAGVRRYRLLAVQHRLRDAGVRQLRRRGEGTAFASLREYTVGDDPRHIDWKATARRGRPIVREFTVEQGQSVIIAIDAGRLMTQLSGDQSRFEHALSAALVLADVAVHSGDQVGLLLFGEEVQAWIPPARGSAALTRIREALIPAQATLVEPDYAGAFRTLATRHRKRALRGAVHRRGG